MTAADASTRLLEDLNEALKVAKDANNTTVDISDKLVFESEPMQGDTRTARIVLRAVDPDIDRFQVVTATNNTAYTELGLQTQAASTVSLVAPLPVPNANPGQDLQLDFFVRRGASSSTGVVTLSATATADNVALQSLIEDLNAVLQSSGLGIVASQSGGRLVLSAVDSDITGFEVKDLGTNEHLKLLGLELAEANALLESAGVTELPDGLVAGARLRGGAAPGDPFGRLAVDLDFTINGFLVSVDKAGTAGNASVDDLVRSLNGAIEANSDLKGKVAAINEGGRIVLRAIDRTVAEIIVAGLIPDESTALGIANGSSGTGLTLRSTSNAPVSYGVSENTDFTVTINSTDFSASLTRDNTILNRSLYDLAASLNNSMNAALGGANKNPLIATVQSGQIVIGLKTSGTSTNLIGDPSTSTADGGIAPSAVTSFSINSVSDTFVNELKLISATNTANVADRRRKPVRSEGGAQRHEPAVD